MLDGLEDVYAAGVVLVLLGGRLRNPVWRATKINRLGILYMRAKFIDKSRMPKRRKQGSD